MSFLEQAALSAEGSGTARLSFFHISQCFPIERFALEEDAVLQETELVAGAAVASVGLEYTPVNPGVDREFRVVATYSGSGGELTARCRIAGPEGAPVVAVLGGISASRHVLDHNGGKGWWRDFAGPDKAIDLNRWRILSFDYPDLDESGLETISTRDQAAILDAALAVTGDAGFHAVVGSSYGAMVALALAEICPDRVNRLILISGAHRAHPMAQAWRSIQRRIVRLGLAAGQGREALEIARGLAMTTYRSAEEFGERFADQPVEAYLEARGRDFANRFSPGQFLALSESLDSHRVDPARINVPATIIAVAQDQLVPPADMRALATALGGPASYHEISSIFGHDAFLKEVLALTPIIKNALENAT